MRRYLLAALLMPLMAAATVTGEWRVNLLRGTSTQATVTAATEAAAWAACQARIPTVAAASETWTCQTPRYVATVKPNPAPVPIDCVVSAWSDWASGSWSACSNGSQSRTETRSRTIITQAANGGAACPVLTETRTVSQPCTVEPPPVEPPATGDSFVAYVDLPTLPAGGWVTVYGQRLSTAVISGGTVVSQSATKIVVKATGTVTVDGRQVATIRAGRVREATPATFAGIVGSLQAGDVVYLRAGNYSGRYGTTTWGTRSITLGAYANDTAFVGYPGEVAITGNWTSADGTLAHRVTVAGLTIRGGWDAVFGGHWYQTDESGSTGWRVVGNELTCSYGNDNTMTGCIAFGGDGWKVLGNHVTNNATAAINNNHGIYVQVGADDVEIAWNKLDNMRLGHVIQFHNDGTGRLYERAYVHDNEIRGANANDIRGLNVGNVDPASTFTFANNLLINLGQNFSAIAVTGGQVTVEGNTIAGCNVAAGAIQVSWSSAGKITARNNIVTGCPAFGASNGASLSQITSSGTQTNATFDVNYRPTNPVKGVAPTIPADHAGVSRGNPATVGALE